MPAASAGPAAAAAAARAERSDFGGDGDKEDESGSEEADLDAPQGRHFQKDAPPCFARGFAQGGKLLCIWSSTATQRTTS